MNIKKGYIFDFDGVVIDTEKYHYASWAHGFESVGAVLTEKEYLPLKSIGRDYIMTFVEKRDGRKFTAAEKEKIVTAKDEKYIEYKSELSIDDAIEGVLEYIDFLKSQGYKTAVASSSIEAGNTIKQFELSEKFDVVVDGTFGIRRKPRPDMFAYVAKKLGLAPLDCVVFEDSIAGVHASNNACIDCVYIGKTKEENSLFEIENFKDFKNTTFENKNAPCQFKNAGEYKHFKGGEYKFICTVKNEMNEDLVLYKSMKSNSYWLRAEEVFFETVEIDGKTIPRFAKVCGHYGEQAKSHYTEFLTRMQRGEFITFEADMSQYKLSQESLLKVEKA